MVFKRRPCCPRLYCASNFVTILEAQHDDFTGNGYRRGLQARATRAGYRRRLHDDFTDEGDDFTGDGYRRPATDEGCRRGLQRYLPAYSPDMNPIEKAFSKLKAVIFHGIGTPLPRPAGRRSGVGGQAFARLAGFVRALGRAVAFVFPRRRRGSWGPA